MQTSININESKETNINKTQTNSTDFVDYNEQQARLTKLTADLVGKKNKHNTKTNINKRT